MAIRRIAPTKPASLDDLSLQSGPWVSLKEKGHKAYGKRK